MGQNHSCFLNALQKIFNFAIFRLSVKPTKFHSQGDDLEKCTNFPCSVVLEHFSPYVYQDLMCELHGTLSLKMNWKHDYNVFTINLLRIGGFGPLRLLDFFEWSAQVKDTLMLYAFVYSLCL